MTEEAILVELRGINGRLIRIEEKVSQVPELCRQHSESLAVLESQRDEVLPEHERFDTRLKSLEVWRAWALGAVAGAGILSGSLLTLLVAGILRVQF